MTPEIFILALGRICLALYFIIGAGLDIKMRQDTLQMMQAKNIPYRDVLFFCAVALKLFAGFGVMFNILPIISALALALFTLIANIIFNSSRSKKDFCHHSIFFEFGCCWWIAISRSILFEINVVPIMTRGVARRHLRHCEPKAKQSREINILSFP
jgi:uncharacterized membrane protein YphA (DoxX/SURF4 family)